VKSNDKTAPTWDPDRGLAHENYPELNEAFYEARPWDYFAQRWQLLMLTAGRWGDLDALATQGVEYDGLSMTTEWSADGSTNEADGARQHAESEGAPDAERSPETETETDPRAEEISRFVTTESEALLHHVAETVLRAYIAHLHNPPCPWLEMARVRTPGKFKDLVERDVLGVSAEDLRDGVGFVLFGSADRMSWNKPPSETEWEGLRSNIGRYLRRYARGFLAADLYNAAKHGLAIQPGASAQQLMIGQGENAEEVFSGSGPCIDYLAVRRKPDERARWSRTTRWINIKSNLVLIHIGTRLIRSMWHVGAARYCEAKLTASGVFTPPDYESLISETQTMGLTNMAMDLSYYVEDSSGAPATPDQ